MYYLKYTFCHRLLIAKTCIKHVFDVHILLPVCSWSIRNKTIDEEFPNENFSKVLYMAMYTIYLTILLIETIVFCYENLQWIYTYITILRLMSKERYFAAVDRYRCIMQPDRPHFSSGAAIVISIFMMIASVALCVPKFVTATVICFGSKYVELDVIKG